MKIIFFLFWITLCMISHPHIVKISYSWPGIPYPFRGPSGEIIMGLGLIGDMEPTPDGEYFCIKGDSGRKIYMFNPKTGVIENTYISGNNCHILVFSPDGTKLLAKHNQNIYQFDRSQSFQIFDYGKGIINFLYQYDNVLVSPDPFSPESENVIFHKDQGIILKIETREETQLPPDVPLMISFSHDGGKLIGIISGEYLYNMSGYYQQPYLLKICDKFSNTVIHSQVLESVNYMHEKFINTRLLSIQTNNDFNTLITIQDESYPPSSNVGATVYIHDIETGKAIRKYYVPIIPASNYNIKISHNKKWAIFFGLFKSGGLVDITKEISLKDAEKTDLYVRGPFDYWTNGVFNRKGDKFYFLRENKVDYYSRTREFKFGVLDISSNEIQEDHIARRDRISTGVLHPKLPYVAIDFFNDIQLWDYTKCEILREIDIPDLKEAGSARFSADGKYLLWGKKNTVQILDASSWTLQSAIVSSPTDTRTAVDISHDGKTFTTASGNASAPGVDNLIRIWDAETFEMLREFRGHRDSVWYAEFSPDDRRIVSASLDGTAKVWDVASGNIVADFTIHNASVEYAAFFPDGERVLSLGKDRRAFIWNVETTQIEKTLENLHFPANLSPDGRHLFAGSEVWDIESGRIIKTLDDFAQDYACLTLSPDGTQLLTSEEKGLTKIWNVPEHILKPSGIEHFQIYEGKEEK